MTTVGIVLLCFVVAPSMYFLGRWRGRKQGDTVGYRRGLAEPVFRRVEARIAKPSDEESPRARVRSVKFERMPGTAQGRRTAAVREDEEK